MMKNSITKLLIFAAGAVIGSAVTWKFAEEKYKRIADEEIASVKEVFSKKEKDLDEDTELIDEDVLDSTIKEVSAYIQKVSEYGYSSEDDAKKGGGNIVNKDRPYIIPPEMFDEEPDYDAVTLTYYNDGVVADMWDEKVDDVDDTIGSDSLNHFGEYEEDSVFVRNDNLKTDYEILRDYRNYSDIVPCASPEQVDE